jgi:glycogen phosphorylase
MSIPLNYLLPPLPDNLEVLAEIAMDIRWSWNHYADNLWKKINLDLWEITGNPWLILQTTSAERLRTLSIDNDFINLLNKNIDEYRRSSKAKTWFQQQYANRPFKVAYFSMEYGISEALPLYSGGLGILAGDYLKTASDLGVPVYAVGLLYQQGYFRQIIDSSGNQTELYPHNDPSQLPVMPVRDEKGEWLRIPVNFPGRKLWLRTWEVKIGRVKLYLLDSNDPVNSPSDRGITAELYGGGPEIRLQQEIILGIGGYTLLNRLDIDTDVCHLNEGHAAFAVLERARSLMKSGNLNFRIALAATRAGNIFTTHTSVEVGFDRFPPELITHYMTGYAQSMNIDIDEILDMGRQNPGDSKEYFNMALLATRGSCTVNAVSRLHSKVSRRIFQQAFPRRPNCEIPVTYITNGVHMPSWDSAITDNLWTDSCGKERWIDIMSTVTCNFKTIPDRQLWQFRMTKVQQLIDYIRIHIKKQSLSIEETRLPEIPAENILNPNFLTIGFARRFTGYKRPNLLLSNPQRLTEILNHPHRPVQLIIAGKAHPQDLKGKEMIREWWQYSKRPEIRDRVVFLADYDMDLASHIIQGIDLWINTPLYSMEACGTSGMKVLVNGGLNVSELDGWWDEAYCPEVGWAIGDKQDHGEDRNWDSIEAGQLYSILEHDIIPCFYELNEKGIPQKWTTRMRASMSELTPQYSSNRMLREYVDKLYSSAALNFKDRIADQAQKAKLLAEWQTLLDTYWTKLYFGEYKIKEVNNYYEATVPVYLDNLSPENVQVQLYAEPGDGQNPEIHVMAQSGLLPGSANKYLYTILIPVSRPSGDYTPRIIPYFDGAAVPLEAAHILWLD